MVLWAVASSSAQPYNRSLNTADLRIELNPDPTPDHPYLLTGGVQYETDSAEVRDLSCIVSVWINDELVGIGGGGSGGTCGPPGTTQRITIALGMQISGNPPLFDCSLFCIQCMGYDVNICVPPNVSPGPVCMCQQECIPFRVTGFGVPIAELGPDDIVEVALSVFDTGLPEIDPSDDQIVARAGDIARCRADTNLDGILSPADFTAWIAAFNAMAPACDQNDDSLCTPADFTAWIANYNAGC